MRLGGEFQHSEDNIKLPENSGFTIDPVNDNFSSLFAESDIYLSTKLVARVGLRFEHTAFLNKSNLAPRLSLAYKLNDVAQFSFAYGDFYQKADSLLRWHSSGSQNTNFQKATHYILNYQVIKNDRTFRVEGFYKNYDRLVETDYRVFYPILPVLNNNGTGWANGVELFYRDKKTIKGMDYWISYSYLDTKRKYIYYPIAAQPAYAANHNASLRIQKFFTKISSSLSATYSYASGRPYFNPNRPDAEFLTDRAPDYHNLGVSYTYLTNFYKAFTVLVLSVNNVLGADQVYGYRYSTDSKTRASITPPAPRFFFVGAFLSWGQDRSKEVINNN